MIAIALPRWVGVVGRVLDVVPVLRHGAAVALQKVSHTIVEWPYALQEFGYCVDVKRACKGCAWPMPATALRKAGGW